MKVRSDLADWVSAYSRRVRAFGRRHLTHFRICQELKSTSARMASLLDTFHERKLKAASPEQLAELLRMMRPLSDKVRRTICTLEGTNFGIWHGCTMCGSLNSRRATASLRHTLNPLLQSGCKKTAVRPISPSWRR